MTNFKDRAAKIIAEVRNRTCIDEDTEVLVGILRDELKSCYYDGYDDGYFAGHSNGYDEGYYNGYDDGDDSGHSDGHVVKEIQHDQF